MVARTKYTAVEFDHLVHLPENANKRLELVGGEVVEVVSNNYSSETAANLLAEIILFTRGKNLGRVTGADGGYNVGGERYIPDVGFISIQRQPEPSHATYNPQAPDLAIELLSPSDDTANVRIKIVNYLQAGTTVWLVDPVKKLVEVYVPGASPQTLTEEDMLDGGTVLPGFQIPVKTIFPE